MFLLDLQFQALEININLIKITKLIEHVNTTIRLRGIDNVEVGFMKLSLMTDYNYQIANRHINRMIFINGDYCFLFAIRFLFSKL